MNAEVRRNACNLFNTLCFVSICGIAHAHNSGTDGGNQAYAGNGDASASNTLDMSLTAGGISARTMENRLLGAPTPYLDPYSVGSGYARTLSDSLLGVGTPGVARRVDRAAADVRIGTPRAGAIDTAGAAALGGAKANGIDQLAQPETAARQLYGGGTSRDGGRREVYRSPW